MPVVEARPAAWKPQVRRATAADILRTQALATARLPASDPRGPLRKFLDAIPGWWAEIDKNNTSLYVFHERSRFRRLVWRLLNWRWFDRFVMSVIVANCVTLAMYDPTQAPDATWNRHLDIVESGFTFVFLAEMALQVVARNFFIGPGAYLKHPWFALDFCIVVVGVISFAATALGTAGVGGNVTGVRALRALKPLRTLNGVPGVRVAASVVLDAAPLVSCALALLAWLFLVFSIMGVDAFAGLLTGRCFQTQFSENEELASLGFVRAEGNLPCDARAEPAGRACGSGETCLRDGFGALLAAAAPSGVPPFSPNPNGGYTSFDDVGIGCLTVFQALTKRGWALAATQIEAAVGVGAFVKSFFALAVLLGGFFAARVITAIVVAEYARTSTLEERARRSEPNIASEKRRDWEARGTKASSASAGCLASCDAFLSAQWSYQRPFRRIVQHWTFDAVTTMLVVANTAAMAFEHHGMSSASASFLEFLNFVFVVAFAAELLAKLAGLGAKAYFADTFNTFDFAIVVVGVAELLFSLGGGADASALRAFRLLRVLRAAKVFKSSRRARAFSEKIILDVAAARDLASIAAVFIFVFAILGMQLFGGAVPFGERPFGKHFDDVFSATLAVFEMLTASQWHDAAWRGMDAAGSGAALYFAAWMFVGHFLFLDVLLAALAFNFGKGAADKRRERAKRAETRVSSAASDGDSDETDARGVDETRGVLDAEGGEAALRRGARQFAEEVRRMKTWLRQTDQAYFDDSGDEGEDPGELFPLDAKGGSGSGDGLDVFGSDLLAGGGEKSLRDGSRTPEKGALEPGPDDGDDGGLSDPSNVTESPNASALASVDPADPRGADAEAEVRSSDAIARPSPRRGAATETRAPVDAIDAFLSARSAATPRAMPYLTARTPDIAAGGTVGGSVGGSVGFAAVSSLALHLARLGARARDAAAESRRGSDPVARRPRPGPVTESRTRGADDRKGATSPPDGAGFDFGGVGGVASRPDDGASSADDAATRTTRRAKRVSGVPNASLFARVTAARARGAATRRAAAAGRAPLERRAFASLLAEGAAVASRDAGTHGRSETAKGGAEPRSYAGVAATPRRRESVDGVDDPRSAPERRDPAPGRVDGRDGTTVSGTSSGTSSGESTGTRPVDALAESALVRLRDRKARTLAIPPLRDADAFAAPTTEDLALPPEPKTSARGGARSTSGGERRFDGVPDRDVVVVHVPLTSYKRPPRRASERTAADAMDALNPKTPLPVFMKSRSLFLFSPRNAFRRACFTVAFDRTFETAVVLVILASSALIAAESPGVAADSPLGLALSHLDVAFAAFFSCEAAAKIIAMGFIAHPGAYARDPWHAMDGAVTAASVLAVFARSDAFAALRVFRVARALRPLRLVKRFRGMRVAAASLALAFPEMVDVFLFGLFQHAVFAILGVQLFAGKFWRCTDDAVTHRDECVGAFIAVDASGASWIVRGEERDAYGAFENVARFGDFGAFHGYEGGGHALERRWVNPVYNFDNTGNAMLSLFVMTTLDRWMEMTTRGVDAPAAVGDQPSRDANPAAALFFVAFAVVSGIFWTRLLAACVVDAYRRVSAVNGDVTFETPGQKKWADALKMKKRHAEEKGRAALEKRTAKKRRGGGSSAGPHPDAIFAGGVKPALSPRALALRFTRWRPFELFVHMCIVANVVVMASGGAGESARSASTRAALNVAFGWIFAAELLVKLLALGLEDYWRDPWNRLDLVVVLGTLPTLLFGVAALGPGVAVLRAFRLGRVFRLFQGTKSPGRSRRLDAVAGVFSALFDALVAALPSIAHVGALLFVLLYAYAALAVRLFGSAEDSSHQFAHEDCTFATFPDAAYCLFRVLSGDDWSRVAAETFAGCELLPGFETGEYSEDTCAPSSVAVSALFFVTFVAGAAFVVLNVFVAVVMDTFAEAASGEGLMAAASFFDLLKRKMLLDGFAETLKKRVRAHGKKHGDVAAARHERG